MSALGTGPMSAVEAGQMSAAETGQMSVAETGRKRGDCSCHESAAKTGLGSVRPDVGQPGHLQDSWELDKEA